MKKSNKKRSTGPSRVVPHRSTTPARTCLTSLFGWEAVSQADMAALTTILEFAFQYAGGKSFDERTPISLMSGRYRGTRMRRGGDEIYMREAAFGPQRVARGAA